MSEIKSLIDKLEPEQQSAINIIKLCLDCFNSADGMGLFSGVTRYNVLLSRLEICAVQADNLPKFWAILLKKMQWPMPPKGADSKIIDAVSVPNPDKVLRCIATETPSLITLARTLHDMDKETRRRLATEEREEFEAEAGNLEGLI